MRILVLGLIAALVVGSAFANKIPVRVKVVDEKGAPVAGVVLSSQWIPKLPELTLPLVPQENLVSDKTGIAEGEVEGRFPIVLAAHDSAKRVGGFVAIQKESKEASLQLVPLRPVYFEFDVDGKTRDLPKAWVSVYHVIPTGANSSTAVPVYVFPLTREGIALPMGEYRFWPFSEGFDCKEKWFAIPHGTEPFKTPKFSFTATRISRLAGNPAPEIDVLAAANVLGKVKLADYRGKWVLLDFWGTWCSPCVAEMPKLIDFYDEFKRKRNQFEVFALHDKRGKSVAELMQAIEILVKSRWAGRRLPFPVLLDVEGKTEELYGISSWPTYVLIDPMGKVVPGGSLEKLREVLSKVP